MRYFITLSYDGAKYHGWQIQPGAITVQEVLNKALTTLLRQPIEVTGAGRTDAGVNASMMVAHFDIGGPLQTSTKAPLPTSPEGEECHPGQANKQNSASDIALVTSPSGEAGRGAFMTEEELFQLRYRLNKLVPPDIAIHKIEHVSDDMHARFSATSRTYHYYVITEKSPFEPYAYRFPQPLDFEKMNEAANILFEYIDFTSFSKLHTDVKTNNCKIMEAHWDQVSPIKWCFTIKADRFLRNMVRAIVGTLIDVGRGAITIDGFRKIIENKDRCSAGTSVPGNALFLCDVTYGPPTPQLSEAISLTAGK